MRDYRPGILTFLFTDIEGSTRLWEEHPQEMERALARHDEIVRSAVESAGGRVIKQTGDGFQAVFSDPSKALECAAEAQKALYAEEWQGIPPLRVRMGLHSGQAQWRGGDYHGPTLNRCHRLMSAAHGGQILVSSTTAELVRDSLSPQISLKKLGEYRLRDLLRSQVIYQVIHSNLPSHFPPIDTLSAYTHNLPVQTTNFIGRDKELHEVLRRLSASRLVVLGGAGGVGKTRLAIQVGAEALDRYAHGVWFVDLSTTQNPSFVPQAIALSLGLLEKPGQPLIDTIVDYLKPRQLLLILDNCEHLIDAVAPVVETILTEAHDVRILATSREHLRVQGEKYFSIPPLMAPLSTDPNSLTDLLSYESVQLFMDRADSVCPGFTLTPENARAIARICDLLDGIPLAIELAVSRLTVLSPQQICDRLNDRFRLLTSGWRTSPGRQKTLWATVEWSYDLLPEPERRLFERLSVFSGSFDLNSVETICADDLIEKEFILDLLENLIRKSLVAVEEVPGTPPVVRYRMLKTLSAFGEVKLKERKEEDRIRRNHLDYFLAMAENVEADLSGSQQEAALERLRREHENILSALHWCVDTGAELEKAIRLATTIWRYWLVRGLLTEGRRLVCAILDRIREGGGAPEDLMAKGYSTAGALSWALGEYDSSERYHQEALRLRRRVGDTVGIAASLNNLAITAAHRKDIHGAIQLLNEASDLLRRNGDKNYLGHTLSNLGGCYIETQNWQLARETLQEGLSIFEETGDLVGKATSLKNLGEVFKKENKTQAAADHFRRALDISARLRYTQHLLDTLGSVADLLKTLGLFDKSVQLSSSVLNLGRSGDYPIFPGLHVGLQSSLEEMRSSVPEPDYTQAWQRGSKFTIEEAVAFARAVLSEISAKDPGETT